MSLKAKVEQAVLALMETLPALEQCHPKQSISADEKQDFPCLWVRALKPPKMAPETPIYKVPVQIVLETEFDDPQNDALFAAIETLTQEHAMIDPINAQPSSGIFVFDNIGGADTEIINPNFRTQTCSQVLVCCEIDTD